MTNPQESESGDRAQVGRQAVSRTVLGALVALLAIAVILALWFLLTGGDGDTTVTGVDTTAQAPKPTPLPIPSSTAVPAGSTAGATPTPTQTVEPTPVPEGFEACGETRAPIVTATYIVDTLSTPLNQRAEPAAGGALVGTFDPGQTGLAFAGDCVVNLNDGYVWWEINNGTEDVWIASDFVTPN